MTTFTPLLAGVHHVNQTFDVLFAGVADVIQNFTPIFAGKSHVNATSIDGVVFGGRFSHYQSFDGIQFGGVHHVEGVAQYELYHGVDGEPDFDAAPAETFTSLPHTTTA